MDLLLVRHLWGVDLSNGYAPYLKGWRELGYGALESNSRMVPDRELLLRAIREEEFRWIPQVYSNQFAGGGTVSAHLASLRQQIEECLDEDPLFINAHTGSDAWTVPEAEDFYGAALELERELGVAISHETHRMRTFGNPWATRAIITRFPELKLTCDFSHWVCVAERLLEDCTDIIELSARQCHHLHARVGFEEGPQVPDPRAPEWSRHLAAHEAWWDAIWAAQRARKIPVSTLTPEFGPWPYLHTTPYTQAPLANLAEICDWMALRQKERFMAFSIHGAVRKARSL